MAGLVACAVAIPSTLEVGYSPKVESVLRAIASGEKLTHVDLSDCGLLSIPEAIFQLKDSLVLLNLGGNQLSSLPACMAELQRLRILFFAQNKFRSIPTVLGKLSSLYMLSFKSNEISFIDELSLSPSICWLILTDNKISEIPTTIGKLTGLMKLMLAGNELSALPDEMQHCQELQLVRLAANKLQLDALPSWFWNLPKLSWLAIAGNMDSSTEECAERQSVNTIKWTDLHIMEKLGEGASGIIYKAKLLPHSDDGSDRVDVSIGDKSDKADKGGESGEGGETVRDFVAVKIFKGGKTSDGLPADEMKASEDAGSHFCSFEVLGRIAEAPGGQLGLVMPLIPDKFKILGGPPSFTSVTRDTFDKDKTFPLGVIMRILTGVSSVCAHLHGRGISHGDIYAHNILVDPEGTPLLSDFGASSFYRRIGGDPGSAFRSVDPGSDSRGNAMEGIEVRAFGCLIDDLITRVDGGDVEGEREGERDTCDVSEREEGRGRGGIIEALKTLQLECVSRDRANRPTFLSINQRLLEMAPNSYKKEL